MATAERRKSFSLFFGFSKEEPKTDPMTDSLPKVRRKLQKVTKQADSTDMSTSSTNTTSTAVPAPDVGGVQTVKLPGDEYFLATKYNASRPPSSRDGCSKLAPRPSKEEEQARRESRTRSFFRSSSTSRVPSSSRSTSCTRTATFTTTSSTSSAIRPSATWGEGTNPTVATAAIDSQSGSAVESQALGDVQDAARAQVKAAQAAVHARAIQMMEEHERLSAQERALQNRIKSTPPSASRTKHISMLPPALAAQRDGTAEKPTARSYPMFHRPYSKSQPQNIISSKESDAWRISSATANRPPYTSRKSMHSAVPAPIAIPRKTNRTSPRSPIPSSAMSDSSSASMLSPTSVGFDQSSASLAVTAATSFDQTHSNLPTSGNGSASSCALSSPSDSVSSSAPYPLGHRRNRSKFDFDHECSDSGSGSDSRRAVPELSYLSGSSSRGSKSTPDSPSLISSADESSVPGSKQRRKIKTPVYAVGQLESGACADEATGVATAIATEDVTRQVELSLLQSKSSIECIAEEYRALLASRNSQSTADDKSELNVDAMQRPVSGGRRNHNRNSNNRNSTSNFRSSVGRNIPMHTASMGTQRKFMLAPPAITSTYKAEARDSSALIPTANFQELPSRAAINSPTPPQPLPPLRTRSRMTGLNHMHNDNVSNAKYVCSDNISNSNIYNKKKTPTPPTQPDRTDNLGLQLCVDLLTRELSSAVMRRSSPAAATSASQRAATRRHLQQNNSQDVIGLQSSTVTSPYSPLALTPMPVDSTSSALQILVMIEAYERLRDQLRAEAQKTAKVSKDNKDSKRGATSGGETSTNELEAMFSLWIKALYRIHDSLTSDEKTGEDYEEDDNDELNNTSDSDYASAAAGT
ncbi:hypothetical protein SPBR_04682 [Sporothrix brasiliensis 5110]|uniref:Uncharacterized protein n=1 Tax=Sporothrix brasiliensis 5110 TaxID=1398154 RepID=A0A0C2IJV1_9PEZI|nr:uncharacterized protein SPBR_04682 [Sporothrix brasiliensis 5110]KIH87240.1 hypothetical protein SPBR_04682 [Sporothrix brasiliensis 5110]